jgi:hypothetical protein
MGVLYRDGERPPQKALEIIVGYMHRVAHPLYLGYISLEVRYSLARTQEMMEYLQDQGVVRPLSEDEKRIRGFRIDANLWVLSDGPQLSKARF